MEPPKVFSTTHAWNGNLFFYKLEDEGRTLVVVVAWPSLMKDMERVHVYWEDDNVSSGGSSSGSNNINNGKGIARKKGKDDEMNLPAKKLSLMKKLADYRGR